MSEVIATNQAGWRGHLAIELQPLNGRTVIGRQRHSGPLRIQRPFYPEDDVCHVYILHPPGGVVGGDRLCTQVSVHAGASGLLTTPAATKVYRSERLTGIIDLHLQVSAGATLEWLPQGTLLFGGSRLRQHSVVELSSKAAYCGWEVTTLGRPHSGDSYDSGQCEQSVDICIDGRPVIIERQAWRAGEAVTTAPWGLQGKSVLGSLHAYPADSDTLDRAREALTAENIAATVVDGVLAVRALADDAVKLQDQMAAIWANVRPLVIGRPACPPRIWAT